MGLDAGGSKTRGLLVDERGEVLRRATGAGANVRSVGEEKALANLRTVIDELWPHADVGAVCVGAAGAGRAADRDRLCNAVQLMLPPGVAVDVRHDAQIALRAATDKRPALVVIAGTGSLVYGESASGLSRRAGGYGSLIGDAAGAYTFGMAAVRHTARVFDGIETRGPLAMAISKALQCASVADLIERVHVWPPDVAAIAALADLVGDADEEHDPAARRIIDDESALLASGVTLIASNIRTNDELPAIFSGGAFDAVPRLLTEMSRACAETGPCAVQRLAVEPAMGAARIAWDMLREA
ncbi:MAG: N-acetylglucosamine kinase [Candidatus Eremiobacter antarcticus]